MTPETTPQPDNNRKQKAATYAGRTLHFITHAIPVIVGAGLLLFSTASIPVLFGLAALTAGLYKTSNLVKRWFKPNAPKPAPISAASILTGIKNIINDKAKRKKFNKQALIAAGLGAIKVGTGFLFSAKLGAMSGWFATTLSVASGIMGAMGAVAVVGGAIAITAFALASKPRFNGKANRFLDRVIAFATPKKKAAPAEETAPVAAEPASTLGDATAKADFNAVSNDNTPSVEVPENKPKQKPPAP